MLKIFHGTHLFSETVFRPWDTDTMISVKTMLFKYILDTDVLTVNKN